LPVGADGFSFQLRGVRSVGPHSQYEPSDADPRVISWIAAGIATFLIVSPLVLFAIYPSAHGARGIGRDLPFPPAPRLQTDPARDFENSRAADDALLTSYGWTDRKDGVVRIPIDRAMELTAKRGIPGWGQPTSDPQIPPRVPP
jgi:hypothetical protein